MCAAQKAARLASPLFFHGSAILASSSLCKRTTSQDKRSRDY